MRQFTTEQIQAQFEKLPEKLQMALNSTEINETVRAIGDKHALLIDQMGELVDMVGLVMLGLVSPKDFVRSFCKESGVDAKTGEAIAQEINTEVFAKIRSYVQSIQPEDNMDTRRKEQTASAIEKAGGFSVETENEEGVSPVTPSDKNKILSSLENPQPARAAAMKSANSDEKTFTDPLIDQLLSSPAARGEQQSSAPAHDHPAPINLPIVDEKSEPAPQPPKPPQPPKTSPDMYREPLK